MAEKWTKWEPAQGLAANYYIDEILTKVERIVYTLPKPVQDSSDKPEYLQKLISSSLLSEESWNEFFILLTDAHNSRNRILMTFGHPSSYRCTAEKYRPGLTSELEKEYDTSFLNWTFFKVENSLYLEPV